MYNPETETFELKKDKSDMIPMKSNEIPDDLKKSLKDNKCVLFVGSGLSVPSNFPNWPDLMKRMITNLTLRNTRPELLTNIENLLSQNTPEAFLEIATEFRKQENTTSEQYFNFMNEVFNPLTLQLSPNHFLLKKISLRAMITTNYDYLLETALNHHDPFAYDDPDLIYKKDKRFFIFKAHGCIKKSDPYKLILTKEDYEKLYENERYSVFLSGFLQDYTFLFIGYGLRDPDFEEHTRRIYAIFKGRIRTNYVLMEDPGQETIQQLRAERGIEVIPYKKEDGTHSGVTLFLKKLTEIVPKSEVGEILAEICKEQDLSEVSHDPRFMEQRWSASDRDLEWSVYKDKLFVKPELPYEKVAYQRINIIYGPYGVGKSVYLLSYLQHCLNNSFYEHILFLNREMVDEALGEIEEKVKEYAYDPKKTLLVIDGFSGKKYNLFFDVVLSKKYAAVITLRDVDFHQLKTKLGNKWINCYSQISNEIPINFMPNIKEFHSRLLTNYGDFYGIKYKGNIKDIQNQIVQKSNGITAYLVLLLARAKKEGNGVLDIESIREFPAGFEKLILDTIEKNFALEDDKVVPVFLALLTHLHPKHFYLTEYGCRIAYEFEVTYLKENNRKVILDGKFKSLLDYLEKPSLMEEISGRRLSNHWIEALEVLLKDHTENGAFIESYRTASNDRDFRIFIRELKEYLKNELSQRLSMGSIPIESICLIRDLAVLGDIGAAKEFYLSLNMDDKGSQEGRLNLKTLTGLYIANAYEAKSKKDIGQVINCYKEISKLDPDSALTHFTLARSYEKKGDVENAKNEFLTAIELNEKSEEIGANVVETFKIRHAYTVFLTRRFKKASQQERDTLLLKIENQYKVLFRVDQPPPDALTIQSLALFYDEAGNYEKAQEIFLRLINQFPTHVPALQAYARFCQKRGDILRATNTEEAKEYYQLADDYFKKALDNAREQNFSLTPVLNAYAYFKQTQALYQKEFEKNLLIEAYQLYSFHPGTLTY